MLPFLLPCVSLPASVAHSPVVLLEQVAAIVQSRLSQIVHRSVGVVSCVHNFPNTHHPVDDQHRVCGESVSQDLRFCVVWCSVEFAVPQWSHTACELFCLGLQDCTRFWEILWLLVFETSLVLMCLKQSLVMSHFSSTQQWRSALRVVWRTALTTVAFARRSSENVCMCPGTVAHL